MPLPSRMGIRDQESPGEPMVMPVGYTTPTPLEQIISRMVKEAVEAEQDQEQETLEESNDFDMYTDEDLLDFTAYELAAMEPQEPELPEETSPGETATATQEAPQEQTGDQDETSARQEPAQP